MRADRVAATQSDLEIDHPCALREDAAVFMSIALQHRIALAMLAHSMGRQPVSDTETAPESLIRAVVEALAAEEQAIDFDEVANHAHRLNSARRNDICRMLGQGACQPLIAEAGSVPDA